MALDFRKPRDYDSRVFINCPFDEAFKPVFDAMVFAIHDLGFQARHALIDNTTAIRVERIVQEIGTCRYSLHDMSRVELGASNLPRFNMPFEAGIAYAAHAMQPLRREHHLGILDSVKYRYQASISDLAGLDPKYHDGQPAKAIACVRDFLRKKSDRNIPGAAHVCNRHEAFNTLLGKHASRAKVSLAELNSWDYVNDRQRLVADWIGNNPA